MKKENQNHENYTPLINAVIHNDLDTVVTLIEEAKVAIDETTAFGSTALLFAAKCGHLRIAKYLVDHGANRQHRNHAGWNAFVYAAQSQQLALIEYFADNMPLSVDDTHAVILLAASSRYFHLDIVLFILRNFVIGSDEQIAALAKNECFEISGVSPAWEDNFRNAKRLLALEKNTLKKIDTNIFQPHLTNFIFQQLEKNTSLEDFSYCHRNDTYFNNFIRFIARARLKKLRIWESSIDPLKIGKIFSTLAENKDLPLEELNVRCCKIDMAASLSLATFIARNKTLRLLDLGHCDINFETIAPIADAIHANPTRLQILRLNNNDLRSKGAEIIAALLNNPQLALTTLNLSGNRDLDDGFIAIASAMIKNTCLSSLNLSGTHINASPHVAAISNMIEKNKSLHSLNIASNSFKDEQGLMICNALKKNSVLKEIDLSEAFASFLLGNQTAVALSNTLLQNTTIEKINLSNQQNFGQALEYFYIGLTVNHSLKELDISHTRVTDAHFIYLLKAMAANKTLVSLLVNDAIVGEQSIQQLATLLRENKIPLQRLSLKISLHLDEKTLITLLEALKKNCTLKLLTLGRDSVHPDAIANISACLIDVLKDNYTLQKIVCPCDEKTVPAVEAFIQRNNQLANNAVPNVPNVFSVFSAPPGKAAAEENKNLMSDEEKSAFAEEVQTFSC